MRLTIEATFLEWKLYVIIERTHHLGRVAVDCKAVCHCINAPVPDAMKTLAGSMLLPVWLALLVAVFPDSIEAFVTPQKYSLSIESSTSILRPYLHYRETAKKVDFSTRQSQILQSIPLSETLANHDIKSTQFSLIQRIKNLPLRVHSWRRKNRRMCFALFVATAVTVSWAIRRICFTACSSGPALAALSLLQPRGGTMNWFKPKPKPIGKVASAGKAMLEAVTDLAKYMEGPKLDTIILLSATALITPLCRRLGTSPILGFLTSGMLLGPYGCGAISGIHTTETLAELGIVFFLFEMGLELSVERLMSMKKDVFGLGFAQFAITALVFGLVGGLMGFSGNAIVVLGGGLALSSSAFVLQLLKDKNQFATRFGKAAFGVLLFQDLAVVPLLVVTPILAGGGQGLASAVLNALVKAAMALGLIAFSGRVLLNPLFKMVAEAQSQEAFLGLILLTALSMSFMTEGLGLSNTLGAFLAGVLLSETKYRYQVEADIAPFRGILLGLFFVTVGFEIDLRLIASNLPMIGGLVGGILFLKAAVTTALSLGFGLSLSTSQQTGLILSQGGEFAFVAFGLARSLGILDASTTKLMLTSVSLTMAATPLMSAIGTHITKVLEEKSDFTHYLGQDREANEIKGSDDFTVVVGYGEVGKVVCDLLDRKFITYVGLDNDPNKVIQARNTGLPVFYGDIGRQEVADAFNIGKAKAAVVCIEDKAASTRAVISLRRFYPDLKIFARASDMDHATRLQSTLDVAAMVPILPEDTLLLTLPFGAAVMKSLGVPADEVNAIVESRRKELLTGKALQEEEEELELLQLGVITDEDDETDLTSLDASNIDEDDGGVQARKEAAAERREEAKEKSPFVAHVIEEVCPDSVDGIVEPITSSDGVQSNASSTTKESSEEEQ